MIKYQTLMALFISIAFLGASPARAWNSFGHMTVAAVAYEQLTQATRNRVSALLRKNPDYNKWVGVIPAGTPQRLKRRDVFEIAATWPDQIKGDHRYTDDGTARGNRPDGAPSSQNTGYPDLLRHRYWHFVDTPFAPDGTALPAIPNPNAKERIDLFRAVLASNKSDELKSYDLVWLLHLVGDVHQPLHCATRVETAHPDGDNGGNLVQLCAPPCKNELHAFWDGVLGSSSDPNAAARAASALPAPTAILASKSDAADWVKESFEDAQHDVYVTSIGAGTGPFTVSASYKSAAKSAAKQRVGLAGARLANLLNTELK